MTWMLTITGSVVDLRFMAADSISLLDIAHALSLKNRFSGHTTRPYSVAEHSLHVVRILEVDLGIHDPEILQAGLMHDAHEAYTGDLSTPMKQLLGGAWDREEVRVANAVLGRFGCLDAMHAHHAVIKRADLMALAAERRDVVPATGPAWQILDGVDMPRDVYLPDYEGMDWEDWREAFLDRFAELRDERDQAHPEASA